MQQEQQEVCFCTLALGERYRSHALLLAQDIEKNLPGIYLLILTDKPQEFSKYPNVLAFKHQQQSIGCYHDKRFVIAKAISLFNTCIFVDADIRILDKFLSEMTWLPGITAVSCTSIAKHNQVYIDSVNDKYKPKRSRDIEILRKLAKKLDLDLEDTNIQFVMEMLFVITRQDGKEIEFLKHWNNIALYCELNGFYGAEGYAIGMAAAKAGLQVQWDAMQGIVYFKDWVQRQKIKKGQANADDTLIYFQQHETIEYRQSSILQKIKRRLKKFIGYYYRYLYLRIVSLNNFNFYYR
ncbi:MULTISPECIES: hypothetical protein [unclassified Tolypothrix]|uniref:hypothetical protein n=1 Tax=unclassified Tolypothrix TaxID=2649714 RepID=UPI0005F81A1A|nr:MULTISPECIES: hypothetical protein [unclassified Tolypothrix]MBE9082509.1 hypothetical protein [Tolypothrix sp. LEGE 11397]UYD25096.1 hypothetical protein HGR01_27425 [Tolypothrix sp. PCC 7712]UYD32666.1 hypothetical protein HG267_27195 [Tolypothrix sp. PCC 7601]